jgi:hypothetical protein
VHPSLLRHPAALALVLGLAAADVVFRLARGPERLKEWIEHGHRTARRGQ